MARVIVIGGANVDVKGRSMAPFISGTSNPGAVTMTAGGVGRNIAHNLAQLGLDVALIAAVGEDSNGALLLDATRQAGVDCSHIVRVAAPTGTYLAIVDDGGEMVAAVNDMRAADALTPECIAAQMDKLVAADFLVADCNIPIESLAWLINFAATYRKRLLVEPVSVPKAAKLMQLGDLRGVNVVTPNRQQLHALASRENDNAALAVLHQRGIANVVVHCGADGALASAGGNSIGMKAQAPVLKSDVTGAGDAAVAGLVFGLVEGLPLAEAAALGQRAAGLKLASHLSVVPGLSRDRLLAKDF